MINWEVVWNVFIVCKMTMKTIWLLWWMSRVSTVDYYTRINTLVSQKLGKQHSAKILLRSVDYQQIKQYNYKNRDKIGEILLDEIHELSSCNVDCILICNNTIHKAYNEIAPHLHLEWVEVMSIIECVSQKASIISAKNVLLLWTQFVMEDWFYHSILAEHGTETITPDKNIRKEIHKIIQEELSKNIIRQESIAYMRYVIEQFDMDAVVVWCTELPMIISQDDFDVPVLDTVQIHCEKAVEFSLR